jgi:hypothetical protein
MDAVFSEVQKDPARVSEVLVKALNLINVRFLLTDKAVEFFDGKELFEYRGFHVTELRHWGPVFLSRRIKPVKEGDLLSELSSVNWRAGKEVTLGERRTYLEQFIEAMEMDLETRNCRSLQVWRITNEVILPGEGVIRFKLLRHEVRLQRVDLEIETDAEAFARFSYSYSPRLKVFVNGKPAEVIVGASKFVCLRLPAGRNQISFVPGLLPLEKKLFLLAGGILLLLFGVFAFRRKLERVIQRKEEGLDQ